MIFGITPFPKHRSQQWDLTTLVLKKALNKYVQDKQRILEIGTSDLGILSIYLAKKRKHLDITAVDINPDFVLNAIENAKRNNVQINIIQSDLFSNTKGLFDVIFFNAPYLPEECGVKYEVNKCNRMQSNIINDSVWKGGKHGFEIINRFLGDVSKMISSNGKVILGVSNFFVEDTKIKALVSKNNLQLISTTSSLFNPSKAYILTNRKSYRQ
jgi:release factor glutamine methyltransferase